MIKYLIGAGAIIVLASNPTFAIGPNCNDQLAQLKAQLSSELLAQSPEAKQYQEAERLCNSGKDMEAQNMARRIREEMARKGAAGSSGAPGTAGSSTSGTTGRSQ